MSYFSNVNYKVKKSLPFLTIRKKVILLIWHAVIPLRNLESFINVPQAAQYRGRKNQVF